MDIKNTFFLLIFALSSCGEDINNKSSLSEFSGEDLFIQRCASCHGSDGGLKASGSPDLRVTSLSRLEIMEMIENGKNGMPAFKTIITRLEERRKIVNHVLTLKK